MFVFMSALVDWNGTSGYPVDSIHWIAMSPNAQKSNEENDFTLLFKLFVNTLLTLLMLTVLILTLLMPSTCQ